MNVLLVLVPLSLVAGVVPLAPDASVAVSFLAIVPFSGIIHLACESLSVNLKHMLGELFVTLFDNVIELTVSKVNSAHRKLNSS